MCVDVSMINVDVRRFLQPHLIVLQHFSVSRNTLPDLFPSNPLMSHAAGRHQAAFPVNTMQGHIASPTKPLHGSGSSSTSVGRRSPIHEVQMDIISEDLTEESVAPPNTFVTNALSNHTHHHHSPPSPRSMYNRRSSLGAETQQFRQGNLTHNLTASRQRKTGAISSVLQAQITATLRQKQSLSPTVETTTSMLATYLQKRRNSDQLISVSSSTTQQSLRNRLQMPAFNHQQEDAREPVTPPRVVAPATVPPATIQNGGQCFSDVINPNSVSSPFNTHLRNGFHFQNATSSVTVPANHVDLLPQTPPINNYGMSAEGMLSHVSAVLNYCHIPYQLSNGVFSLEHQGVHLKILVCNVPCSIQLQYVAGNPSHYEQICTQLYNQLKSTPLMPPTQRIYTTTVVS